MQKIKWKICGLIITFTFHLPLWINWLVFHPPQIFCDLFRVRPAPSQTCVILFLLCCVDLGSKLPRVARITGDHMTVVLVAVSLGTQWPGSVGV